MAKGSSGQKNESMFQKTMTSPRTKHIELQIFVKVPHSPPRENSQSMLKDGGTWDERTGQRWEREQSSISVSIFFLQKIRPRFRSLPAFGMAGWTRNKEGAGQTVSWVVEQALRMPGVDHRHLPTHHMPSNVWTQPEKRKGRKRQKEENPLLGSQLR